ncbi:HAAS signaling domain-containing protein [Bacillus cereus group sp. BfR-BA-01380]|uniref:HAAS signaling domain-containing protein n=1 Tax=Bacillus cereus group sp. BfR-BA-01380 TaxID=2920324 RepID=UPI001F589C49|nr:DUF1700 domain-containing protein [Bacillus cereus group sp. BfR-BA-01380]
MNKKQFMDILESHLSTLNKEEKSELLKDYETHFAFGLQNNKTEEEIVNDLGDPYDLAKDMLGNRFENYNLKRSPLKSILSKSLFIFLNLLFLPIGLVIWLIWLMSVGVVVIFVISPGLAIIDFVVNNIFQPAKLFLSIGLTGVSILIGILLFFLGKTLWRSTVYYVKWFVRKLKKRG